MFFTQLVPSIFLYLHVSLLAKAKGEMFWWKILTVKTNDCIDWWLGGGPHYLYIMKGCRGILSGESRPYGRDTPTQWRVAPSLITLTNDYVNYMIKLMIIANISQHSPLINSSIRSWCNLTSIFHGYYLVKLLQKPYGKIMRRNQSMCICH
jgi:hypothetical protein